MADYDAYYLSFSPIGVELDSHGIDRVWWLHAPFDATGEALDNPSFEDPDGVVSARPEHWDLDYASNFWDFMPIGGPYPFTESYEHGWDNNETWFPYLEPLRMEWLVFANTYSYEDYESGWGNDNMFEDWPDGHDDMTFGLAADQYEGYESEWPARHPQKDARTVTDYPWLDAGTPATILSRLNELKSTWNAHLASATIHKVADATNTITSANATDEASAVTLVNELWADMWPHVNDSSETWHNPYAVFAQHQPTLSEYPASDYSDVALIGNFLVNHANAHFSWADNSGPLAIGGFIHAAEYTPGINTNFEVLLPMPIVGESTGEEGYEHDWGNDSMIASWPAGSDDDMTFTKDGGTNDYEGYEEKLTLQVVYTSATAGTALDIDPTSAVTVEVAGVTGATVLDVQTLSPGSATWVTRENITSSSPDPSRVVLDDGFVKVRIYTNVFGTGTPAAVVWWKELEE